MNCESPRPPLPWLPPIQPPPSPPAPPALSDPATGPAPAVGPLGARPDEARTRPPKPRCRVLCLKKARPREQKRERPVRRPATPAADEEIGTSRASTLGVAATVSEPGAAVPRQVVPPKVIQLRYSPLEERMPRDHTSSRTLRQREFPKNSAWIGGAVSGPAEIGGPERLQQSVTANPAAGWRPCAVSGEIFRRVRWHHSLRRSAMRSSSRFGGGNSSHVPHPRSGFRSRFLSSGLLGLLVAAVAVSIPFGPPKPRHFAASRTATGPRAGRRAAAGRPPVCPARRGPVPPRRRRGRLEQRDHQVVPRRGQAAVRPYRKTRRARASASPSTS